LVENTVRGSARDLLAAAIVRAEARGWPVVFHCHDEIVIEAPIGTISEQDVLALLLEPPAWATGLPLGGKVHKGPLYLEAPATAEPPPAQDTVAGEADPCPAQPGQSGALRPPRREVLLPSLGPRQPRSPPWRHCRWTQAGECPPRPMTTPSRRAASPPTIAPAPPVTL